MMKWFKNKRTQVAKALPKNSILILGSLPEYFRQVDIKHPYRQESSFYYLSGFEQAESLFLLLASGQSVLFSADKDPQKETWDGPLYDKKDIQKKFLIDEVYYLSQIDDKLSHFLKGKSKIFYDFLNPYFDKKLRPFKAQFKSAQEFLKDFRRIKDKTEISAIEKAISHSIYAHKQTAKALKPGINERVLHGIFIKSIMEKGSDREAYKGIFACGDNANVLHYTQNNSICKNGELLLVDAGAEYGYYSSDITRVYPVSGKFSKDQKKLYEKLLKLQEKLIKKVQPGVSIKQINEEMQKGITQILLEEQILKGSFKENWSKKSYKKYCPHSVGHLMGLDVHDFSFSKKSEGILQAGMVLTIEPGLYISKKDQKVKKELRGVGLRIEDDILVTQTGYKNLTKKLAKTTSEIEELCSQ